MGAPMQDQSTPTAQRNARVLRSGMTDSERKLWSHLRGEQLGVKFRRQHPLGNYVADFACLAPRLIVELDGSQHGEDAALAYDARRTAVLERGGLKVLRFWNSDVIGNLHGVLDTILRELERR